MEIREFINQDINATYIGLGIILLVLSIVIFITRETKNKK